MLADRENKMTRRFHTRNSNPLPTYEKPNPPPNPPSIKCWCHTCRPITISDMRMVLCPTCGNKRCPKATNHTNKCTNSNDPGQEGSIYYIREWI